MAASVPTTPSRPQHGPHSRGQREGTRLRLHSLMAVTKLGANGGRSGGGPGAGLAAHHPAVHAALAGPQTRADGKKKGQLPVLTGPPPGPS